MKPALTKEITIEDVIELTKKHTNDMELGSELRKLLNNQIMKLISMTDFVLEQSMSTKTILNRFAVIQNYAKM